MKDSMRRAISLSVLLVVLFVGVYTLIVVEAGTAKGASSPPIRDTTGCRSEIFTSEHGIYKGWNSDFMVVDYRCLNGDCVFAVGNKLDSTLQGSAPSSFPILVRSAALGDFGVKHGSALITTCPLK